MAHPARPLGPTGAVRSAVLAGAAALALRAAGSPPGLLLHPRATVAADANVDAAVGALAAAAGWLCVAWLAAGVGLVALGALPGTAGRTFDRAAARVTPPVLRRAARAALGFSLAAAPVVALSATTGAGAAHAGARITPAGPGGAGEVPSLDRPVPSPVRPAAEVPPPVHLAAGAQTYRVRSGDCLWTIAAHHLPAPVAADPARVAAAWPRWYAANRALIGPDPSVLHPGQRLTVPEGVS